MNDMLMTLFGVMIIGTFSSEEVFSVDNLNKPTSGNQSEVLKEDVPLENQAIGINLDPVQDSINGEVGSEGSLDLGFFEDIKLEGIYTEIKDNPYIALESDGTWRALKVGNTEITVGVKLTDETINAISDKYPKSEIVNNVKETKKILVTIKEPSLKDDPIGINLSPKQTNISAVVGDSGKLDLGTYGDIQLEGVYSEITDNLYIQLSSDGTWKAIKTGETIIYVTVQLTNKTIEELNNKYPGREIVYPTMPPKGIKVTVKDATNTKTKEIGIMLSPIQDSINAIAGDSGKLDLGTYENIQLEGMYSEITDNPYIQLFSDGTWKAVKAGETTITVDVRLSDKTLKIIKEKYPEGNIVYPTVPPKRLNVTISDSNSNKNNVYISENVTKATKVLPKTGSTKTNRFFQIFGVVLLAWSVLFMKKRNESKWERN
jgi:LPXTG-motif cell wall-anchored protein